LVREDIADEYGLCFLQNVILNMMEYLDKLCSLNGIEYYIIGGTALGAVRHGGFIPWDDDLDIAMTRDNYNKFIRLCRSEKFDNQNFYFQQETVDWPGYFSKVRLLGTHFEENAADESVPYEKRGLFIDVFPLDNVPDGKIARIWWYFCGKMLVAYEQGAHKAYQPKGFLRKFSILCAKCLKNHKLRTFYEHQVQKYSGKKTGFIGGHSFISRFSNTFMRREIWGKATRINFEKTTLLAPEDIKGFLTVYFGDYMTLPPVELRTSHHLLSVDFGRYAK